MPVLQLLSAVICLGAFLAFGFSAGCILLCPASGAGCACSCCVLFGLCALILRRLVN